MANFKLEIVTPEGLVYEGDVQHVRAPGREGSFGVLPSHTPFITPLTTGEIEVRVESKERWFATSGGLADVQGGKVMLLLETAEAAEDIDIEKSKSSMERAEKRLDEKAKDLNVDRARRAIRRAKNRLKVASKVNA